MLDPACGVATALHYRPFVLVPLAKVMISNGTFIHSLPSHAWHKVMISKAMISWYIHFQATLDTKSWYQKSWYKMVHSYIHFQATLDTKSWDQKPWYHGTFTSKPRLTQSHDIKSHGIMVHPLPSHAWHKVMISKIMTLWYIHFQAMLDTKSWYQKSWYHGTFTSKPPVMILSPVMIQWYSYLWWYNQLW